MQKNWYVAYTKPKCEKKVVSSLAKRKIEAFCPMRYKNVQIFRRTKTVIEPMFNSYTFLYILEQDISTVQNVDGVQSILYWMGKPAIIPGSEIAAIKEFTSGNYEILLERVPVSTGDLARIIDEPSYSIEGNVLALKNKTLKLILPSLGYILTAKLENDESIFSKSAALSRNNSFSHS